MESLQGESKNFDHNYRAINLSDLPQSDSQKAITSLKHRMAVQKGLDMIEARNQDPPTLTELASFSGLSRNYFSCVFKEVTGMRLRDCLVQTRLNKAKDLLKDFNLEIKEIAHKIGFRDPNHFCRIFKKKTGVSPTGWTLGKMKDEK